MIEYNFTAEYAASIMIVAILTSFSSDYESKNVELKFIKNMYIIALISVLITIASLVSGVPGTGFLHLTVARVSNILYFMALPVVSLCFLIYANLITVLKFNPQDYRKKALPIMAPYLLYLVVLFIGLTNGKVFSVTETQGYIRGDWFQLPYYVVAFNLLATGVTVARNLRQLHRDVKKTVLLITGLAGLCLYIQYHSDTIIMTGIIHTACILGLHLYALNVKKTTDQLTGVYNRMSLIQTLNQHAVKKEAVSLYVFSLRGMKTLNERYGVVFGDKVLMRVAQIFCACTQEKTVFRYEGDKFALLLNQWHPDHDQLIAKVIAELDTPQVLDGYEIKLDFLYTRVDYGAFGQNVRELISAADYSLSSLKEQNGRVRYLYDTTVVQALLKRNGMVLQIKAALEHNMFEVHYQPIYCQESESFTQAEALVRMRSGDGYLVYPGDFIDLAVKTGLIVQMTYLILKRVCADLRHMLDTYGVGFPIQAISVNFPYLQFTDENMQQKVMAILQDYQIMPSMIKIEITEREMVADSNRTKKIMEEMMAEGFCFELDDFGMDYSNMSVALELPLESIKLDRSFLLAAMDNESNQQFFRHLVAGFHGIGACTICEGVEEQAQLDFVASCGCEYVQGYYFSKPLDKVALQTFLSQSGLQAANQ